MTPDRRAELREMLVSLIQPGPNPDSGVDALHWCIEGRRKIACEALAVMDHLDARERRLREMLAECTDDLEARIDAEYPEPDRLSHPVALRRYERDIAPVLNARAALSEVAPDA